MDARPMDAEDDEDFAAAFGGPSAEDLANGAAGLAAAMVREAQALATTAAALQATVEASSGALSDVRRIKLAQTAAAEATFRAALLLEAAEPIGGGGAAEVLAMQVAALLKRHGAPPDLLNGPLRAAALAIATDDGSARVAAATLAQGVVSLLGRS